MGKFTIQNKVTITGKVRANPPASPSGPSTSPSLDTPTFDQSNNIVTNTRNIDAIRVADSGNRIYVGDASFGAPLQVDQYATTAPYDTTTLTYQTSLVVPAPNTRSIDFSNTGLAFYVFDGDPNVREFTLTTAYDLATATLNQTRSLSTLPSMTGTPYGGSFNNTGTKMYVLGLSGTASQNNIIEYDLASAYDIQNATFSASFNIGATAPNTRAFRFSSSGLKLYTSQNNGPIREHDVATAFDLSSTITFVRTFAPINYIGFRFEVAADGSRLYYSYNGGSGPEIGTYLL